MNLLQPPPIKTFLTQRKDYLHTYKGIVIGQPLFTMYVIKGETNYRLGITIPVLTGNAVIRNRFKRWTREIYRKLDLHFSHPCDINLFINNKKLKKENYKNVTFQEFKNQVEEAFQKAYQRS